MYFGSAEQVLNIAIFFGHRIFYRFCEYCHFRFNFVPDEGQDILGVLFFFFVVIPEIYDLLREGVYNRLN